MQRREKIKQVELIRHSLAHLLAAAVLRKFPGAKLGIGPIIENGFYYDFLIDADQRGSKRGPTRNFTEEDLREFEKTMRGLIARNLPFSGKRATAAEAKKIFKDQPFKLELIKDFTHPPKGVKKQPLSIYKTGEVFSDLCEGCHIKNTSEINPDSFKLTKIAGAYWRGSEKNPQMQRIYGIAFETKKELDEHIGKLAEAEKRDHRILGEKLELFMIDEKIGKGLPLWLPNGYFIRHLLEEYIYNIEKENSYLHVLTPHLAKENLYKTSGHLAHYKSDMYAPIDIEGEKYYLRPMNCPHHHSIYGYKIRSYKDLPLRIAEFGTVYRNELSGVLTGLIRTRGFTQNDAHIYTSPELLEKEIETVLKIHDRVYKEFNITNYWYRLSLPDFKNKEKYGDIKNKKMWQAGASALKNALEKLELKFIETVGEASFYGPKIDIQIKNIHGKEDTIATIQVDYYSANKFNLSYIDKDGKEKPPVIIHRAIFGSFERFFSFLLEQTAGAFPLWLARVQVKILPVSEKFEAYGKILVENFKKENIRAELDSAGETLGKRIREAEMQKIPYILVVGEKEAVNQTVNVRHTQGGQPSSAKATAGMEGEIKIDVFIKKLIEEINNKIIW